MDALDFQYKAELQSGVEDRRFEGSVLAADWKSEHVTNTRFAAWAFVRGQCDRAGLWVCQMQLSDKMCPELRKIEVFESDDGTIFRRDVPEDDP